MLFIFKKIALRDIKVSWSGGSTSSMVVGFFIIVVTLGVSFHFHLSLSTS